MEERFKVSPHDQLPGKTMIEYLRDGESIANIYPHEDGIRIVSKYLDGVEHTPEYPPSVVVKLNQ